MSQELIIADKIDELCNSSIEFLERNFHELTPAGKFQACIWTAAEIIHVLDVNIGSNKLHGERMKKILDLLSQKFTLRYKQYREEYEHSSLYIQKLNNDFLDKLLKASNDMLITEKNNDFIKRAIVIGISEIWQECNEYTLGFERSNSGKGKAIFPEITYISLYIHPFFNAIVNDNNKPQMCAFIDSEIEQSNLEGKDFMLVPAKISDFLLSKINSDKNFLDSMSPPEKSKPNIKSKNSGCILFLSFIFIASILVSFIV